MSVTRQQSWGLVTAVATLKTVVVHETDGADPADLDMAFEWVAFLPGEATLTETQDTSTGTAFVFERDMVHAEVVLELLETQDYPQADLTGQHPVPTADDLSNVRWLW